MKNYNAKNRSERTKDFGKKRGRDSGKPTMHHAKCNNCGKDCEVPFKPTGSKPIYCSSCFEKNQDDGPQKYGRERSDKKFKSGDSRKRNFESEKERETDYLKKEIGLLNKKLDKILEILTFELSEDNDQEDSENETEMPIFDKKSKKKMVAKKRK